MCKKIFKIIAYLFASLAAVLITIVGITTILYLSADMKTPQIDVDLTDYVVTHHPDYSECRGNYIRQSESGLWETYLHGDPISRGVASGRMSEDLLYYQESVFINQIREIVPSDSYLKFLRFILVTFNRNLGEHIPPEFREEIYGISLSCTHEFDAIGTPYERQLNYHAAHDIGHTMQDYMLVGCSSFGVWDSASSDSTLLIGRNFDFWVGDDFATNKQVSFYAPENGYKFASVGWPGMTGVLSGMNEKGLTVTINAAKGALPTSSAMPISVLSREILQYASSISEALEIAEKRHTFVSESLLIGSATDGRAAIIEKTPQTTSLYTPEGDHIICTNHFQSEAFADDKYNVENIQTSDSPYRFTRIYELSQEKAPIDAADAASILRDRYGWGNADIGLTNEKSLNQSIAHHSVIFKPEEGLMWVSTAPWQSGEYVCYNLNKVFADPDFSTEICDTGQSLPVDAVFIAQDYNRVLDQRKWSGEIKSAIREKRALPEGFIDTYLENNPQYYYAWELAADYALYKEDAASALEYLQTSLSKEIPRLQEREAIEKKIKKIER